MTVRRGDPATVFVRGLGTAVGLEWGVWLALTVYWIVVLDLTPFRLVVVGVVLEASVLLLETPTGVVADVYSRRRSVILGHLTMGLSFIGIFATTNFWLILPALGVFGLGWTLRSGADTAWIADEAFKGEDDHDELERLLLRRNQWGIALSLIVGPLTIAVGWWQSVRVVGIALGVLYLLLAGALTLVMSEDNFSPAKERDVGITETFRTGIGVVRSRKQLRVLAVVIFLFFLGVDVFDRLGYVHFLDSAGLQDVDQSGESLLVLGLLFFVFALVGLALNKLAERYLASGRGVARLAVLLLLVTAVGGFIAAGTSVVVVIGLGYLLQDSTREALWPVIEGWVNRDAPTEVRATVHSMMGQMTSVGQITGGLLLGALADATRIPTAMAVGAAFFLLAAGVATRGIVPPARAVEDEKGSALDAL